MPPPSSPLRTLLTLAWPVIVSRSTQVVVGLADALMVADERETAGAVPLSEVVAARNEILKAARGLMEAGEFSPATGGEELVS